MRYTKQAVLDALVLTYVHDTHSNAAAAAYVLPTKEDGFLVWYLRDLPGQRAFCAEDVRTILYDLAKLNKLKEAPVW